MAYTRRPRRPTDPILPLGYDVPDAGPAAAAPAATMLPLTGGGGGSRFQQSIDRDRALAANKAATFASAAPLPKNDRDSAYGSVAASQAARTAFVGDQQARANLSSGNYFAAMGMANDANARANSESGAAVRETDSRAGLNTAKGTLAGAEAADLGARGVMYPAQARLADAQARKTTSEAGALDYMLPFTAMATDATANKANADATRALTAPPDLSGQLATAQRRVMDVERKLNTRLGIDDGDEAGSAFLPAAPAAATTTQPTAPANTAGMLPVRPGQRAGGGGDGTVPNMVAPSALPSWWNPGAAAAAARQPILPAMGPGQGAATAAAATPTIEDGSGRRKKLQGGQWVDAE